MSLSLRHLLVAVTLLLQSFVYAQSTGKISGYVKDAKTDEPLVGVSVALEGTTLATITDVKGYYKIEQVPTKSYTVFASYLGYKTLYKYDVIITSGNTYSLNFQLEESFKELSEVKIVASPFSKSNETPLSVQTLSRQEVISYPGGNNDIAKVVQSLPGVSGSVGFRNDIIIRGGAPNENVYYLDGIEIPNINHFATQGSSGGPVGMINVSFIEDVTLSTSSFNSRYDNPLSGVLQFRQRNGSEDRTQGNFRLGASEAAFTLEGPLLKKNKNITYIISARRSYLQFLFKFLGLPFLPSYWDYQYKMNWKIDDKNEISLIGLGSIDDFELNKPERKSDETDEEWFSRAAIYDRIPVNSQWSSTIGLVWKHRIKNGSLNIALSGNYLNNEAVKYDSNDASKALILKYKSVEDENKLRVEVSKYKGKWKYAYGFNAQNSEYSNSTYSRLQAVPLIVVNYNTSVQFLRYGLFAQATRSFGRFSASAGLRTDGNTFTNDGNELQKRLSPRLAATYALTTKVNVNASVGRYYKIAPYTVLGFRDNTGKLVNKDAPYIQSDHLTAGVEYLPFKATRITVEGFYKWYDNYPVSNRDSISLANLGGDFGVLGNEDITGIGRGRTYGVEICLQQKFVKNFYGILAYTYYHSQFTGFDRSRFIPSGWDNRHLISFTGGYKFKRNWEMGLRYRYLGKAPYTPIDTLLSRLNYGVRGGGIPDYSRVNSQRLGTYSVMDIRIDKKWNFKKSTLDIYLDIQNVTGSIQPGAPEFVVARNAANQIITVDGLPYNGSNGKPVIIKNLNSGTPIPSIGVIVEF